jgi:hypothetical protein
MSSSSCNPLGVEEDGSGFYEEREDMLEKRLL